MFSRWLTAPDNNTAMSKDVKFFLAFENSVTQEIIIFHNFCARVTNCNCFSHAVSCWTVCNFYDFRCRLLQKILCSQFRNLQLCTYSVDKIVWIPCGSLPNTIHVFIQSPRLPRRILVSTLPVSLNCRYHLLMLFLSGSLTPYF